MAGQVREAGKETLSETITLAPNPKNKCFGCGADNADGMKLTFEQDNANRRIVGRFVLGERYQGGGGFGTGGSLAPLWVEGRAKAAGFGEVRGARGDLRGENLNPAKEWKE